MINFLRTKKNLKRAILILFICLYFISSTRADAAGSTAGAATGAGIGTLILPGIGTIIGGGLGYLFGSNETAGIRCILEHPVLAARGSEDAGTLEGCVAILSYGALKLVVWVFGFVAVLFNYVIVYSLNMSELLSKVTIVDIGWTAFRDIINILFIFLVLYIAINTIIGNASYGIKTMLSKIILAAIFINFSLFFTQAMIDVSNILALSFYNKITNNVGSNVKEVNSGISAVISRAIGIETILDSGKGTGTNPNMGKAGAEDKKLNLNATAVITYCIGSIVFILITAFVLLAGAIMLIIRALTLIFLMILSPIAFVGGVIPQAKDAVGKWWKALTSNLIFAPVYMAFIYLVIYMTTRNNESHNLVEIFYSDDWNSNMAILINMIVINALMAGSLVVAHSFGVGGSSMAMSWGKTGLNKLRDTSLAPVRGIVGGGAAALSQSGFMKSAAGSRVGRAFGMGMLLRGSDKLSKAKILGGPSFDEARKAKSERLTKTAELIADVKQRSGESDPAFEVRKDKAMKKATNSLGLKTGGYSAQASAQGAFKKKTTAESNKAKAKKERRSKLDQLELQLSSGEYNALNVSNAESEIGRLDGIISGYRTSIHTAGLTPAQAQVLNAQLATALEERKEHQAVVSGAESANEKATGLRALLSE